MFDISNIYEPKTMEEALDILDNKENIKINCWWNRCVNKITPW